MKGHIRMPSKLQNINGTSENSSRWISQNVTMKIFGNAELSSYTKASDDNYKNITTCALAPSWFRILNTKITMLNLIFQDLKNKSLSSTEEAHVKMTYKSSSIIFSSDRQTTKVRAITYSVEGQINDQTTKSVVAGKPVPSTFTTFHIRPGTRPNTTWQDASETDKAQQKPPFQIF